MIVNNNFLFEIWRGTKKQAKWESKLQMQVCLFFLKMTFIPPRSSLDGAFKFVGAIMSSDLSQITATNLRTQQN